MRLLGILAILAAVLAVFFGRAIAGGMGALGSLILCHNTTPFLLSSCFATDPKTQNSSGQAWTSFQLGSLTQNNRSLSISQSKHHGFIKLNRMFFSVDADNEIQG